MRYAALSREAVRQGLPEHWAMKPKLHLFQELGEYMAHTHGNPKNFWNYKDEDFVGWLAKMARSRGGPKSAATAAKAVIDRYRALCSGPRK
eukprot:1588321-Lingulodinium_polyedra.AAC.1